MSVVFIFIIKAVSPNLTSYKGQTTIIFLYSILLVQRLTMTIKTKYVREKRRIKLFQKLICERDLLFTELLINILISIFK